MSRPYLAIVGPTATGKSEVAVRLALTAGGEVVNADAMQLYRGMDIGTAKMAEAERRGIPHHQIDVLDVWEEASVAAYQRDARADLTEIAERGRLALLVGGSGLYARAALDRLEFPGADPKVRSEIERRAAAVGPGELHAELAVLDPAAARAIDPANTRRIVRALEVIALTGRPFTATMPVREYAAPAFQVGLRRDLEALDKRIGARVEAMFAAGLVDEVAGLVERGLRRGKTAPRAVGYAETLDLLDGLANAAETRERIALATRQLARRQIKWFRRDPRIHWLDADPAPGESADALADRLASQAAEAAGL